MLKMMAECERDGRPFKLVIFGLSHKNLEQLKAGKPIICPGEQVGVPGIEVMIFSGETEQSMGREFAEFIGPETRAKIDPKLRDG